MSIDADLTSRLSALASDLDKLPGVEYQIVVSEPTGSIELFRRASANFDVPQY